MADQLQDSSVDQDTRTRKTVRLHTIPAAQEPPKAENVISTPLTAKNTDTGNLEILSDTQTRRTLKLKPIAPNANPAVQPNISKESSDTTTRKTVLLRPLATPAAAPAPAPAVTPAAAPAVHKSIPMPPGMGGAKVPAAVPVLATKTAAPEVKAAVPAPAPAPAPEVKAVAVPAAAAPAPAPKNEPQENTNTAAIAKPAPDAAEDDQTVKLKRPPRLTPTLNPTAAAPAAENQKATIKLPPPKLPGLGAKPPVTPSTVSPVLKKPQVPPSVPKSAAAVPPPAPTLRKEGKEPEVLETQKPAEEIAAVPVNAAEVQKPSLLYLLLTLTALIFIILSGTISGIHYLDLCHGTKLSNAIPGLPVAR